MQFRLLISLSLSLVLDLTLSLSAAAADWACHAASSGACAYGFGPMCQPHYLCPNPQQGMCLVQQPPLTTVCSTAPGTGVCDMAPSNTGAVPDGVLCCTTSADCPAPPSYGQPPSACGSMACNNGYCVTRSPQNPGTGDASDQPCCRNSGDCHTSKPCSAAWCGADSHCHVQAIPGCCGAGGPGCPGSQACQVLPGNAEGLCTKGCQADTDCDLGDCHPRVCNTATHICILATDGAGKPLSPTPGCCRTDRDCQPLGPGRQCNASSHQCTPALPAAGTVAVGAACGGTADCQVVGSQIPVCAACVGDCAGCRDSTAAADGKCQNCQVAACKASGAICTTSYLAKGSCVTAGNVPCAQADPTLTCDAITGMCIQKSCDDGNACTADGLLPDGTCVHSVITGACDDGDACTQGDLCSAGVCVSGTFPCNDNNSNTIDRCNGQSGIGVCSHFNPCDDQDPCTVDTVVNPSPVQCTKAPATNGTPCSDGSACSTGDTCQQGVCTGGTPRLFTTSFDHLFTNNGGSTQSASDTARAVAIGAASITAVGSTNGADGKAKGWMVGTNLAGAEVCRMGVGVQESGGTSTAQAVLVVPTAGGTSCSGGPCDHPGQYAVVGYDWPPFGQATQRGFVQFAGAVASGAASAPEGAYNKCAAYGAEHFYDNVYGSASAGDQLVAAATLGDSLILMGQSQNGDWHPWILRTDLNGAVLWNYVDATVAPSGGVGDVDNSNAGVTVTAGTVLAGGSVVLAGYTTGSKWWMGMYNPAAATNKRMGAPLTASGFLANTTSHLYGIAALGDGGAVAVGDYVDGSVTRVLMVRVSPTGSVEQKSIGTGYVGQTAVAFADGSLAIGASAAGSASISQPGAIFRLGPTGAQYWALSYANNAPAAAVGFDTSSLLVAGLSSSNGNDFWLGGIDVGGNTSCQNSKACYGQNLPPAPSGNVCKYLTCSNGTWGPIDNFEACDLGGADQCFVGKCAGGVCGKVAQAAGWKVKPSGVGCQTGNECMVDAKCDGVGGCGGATPAPQNTICGGGTLGDTCSGRCPAPAPNVTSFCGYAPQGSSCSVGLCSNANSGFCAANHTCVGATEAIRSGACGVNSVCGGTRCMTHP